MIKANELRIGNWVLYPHTQPELYQIIEPRQIGNAHILIPIPLTPEWLERCGLAQEQPTGIYPIGKQFYLKEYLLRDETGSVRGYILLTHGYHGPATKPHIIYLHQLQNLYFALTSEELNVKL